MGCLHDPNVVDFTRSGSAVNPARLRADPDFRAEIEKSQSEFDPAPGEQVQKFIQHTAGVPQGIAERAQAILPGR